ncbi:MAG: ankyrin repeat domain-containing protein [Coxiellaceae bacterium]|nr:ankyrin repeat domain-containing protein [Coxiellaceae bacterium]
MGDLSCWLDNDFITDKKGISTNLIQYAVANNKLDSLVELVKSENFEFDDSNSIAILKVCRDLLNNDSTKENHKLARHILKAVGDNIKFTVTPAVEGKLLKIASNCLKTSDKKTFSALLNRFDFKPLKNKNNDNLLMLAIKANAPIELIHKCVEAEGMHVNAVNSAGETALMMAAHKGNIGAIDYLLSKGADKKIRDNSDKKAKDHFIGNNSAQSLESKEDGAGVTSMKWIVKAKTIAAAEAAKIKGDSSALASKEEKDARPAHQITPKADRSGAIRRRSLSKVAAARHMTAQDELKRPASAGSNPSALFVAGPDTPPQTPPPPTGSRTASTSPTVPGANADRVTPTRLRG